MTAVPMAKLKHLFRIVNGSTPTPEPENWDGGIPWATPIDIGRHDGGLLQQTERSISQTGLATCAAEVVPPGSLALSTRAPIGYVTETVVSMAVNQGCRLLVPRPGICTSFYRYVLSSKRAELEALGRGSTFVELGTTHLGQVEVPAPPEDEQRAIVQFLDEATAKIDCLIEKNLQLATAVAEKENSEIAAAVLGHVDPTTGTKSSLGRGGDDPAVIRLGSMLRLHRGLDLSEVTRIQGDYPVVSSAGVSGRHNEAAVRAPGVVTGRYGSVGSVFYVDEPFWPLNTTLYVSEFRGADPRYTYYVLRALPLQELGSKSAVPGVDRKDVHSLFVPKRTQWEQQDIASALDQACGENQRVMERLDETFTRLREYKAALITFAVTGQIDVGRAA